MIRLRNSDWIEGVDFDRNHNELILRFRPPGRPVVDYSFKGSDPRHVGALMTCESPRSS
jgi:hypothetical protein